MKTFLLLLCALVALPGLGRGDVLRTEPAIIEHPRKWFERTDPARFFAKQLRRGRVFFIGVYDPAAGADSPAPGIPRNDPDFRVSRTVFVPRDASFNPRRDENFTAAVRAFARRYNPLVLAYLKQHPAEK